MGHDSFTSSLGSNFSSVITVIYIDLEHLQDFVFILQNIRMNDQNPFFLAYCWYTAVYLIE